MNLLTLKNNLIVFSSFLLFSLAVGTNAWSQTTIWSDNFNNGCTSDCVASTYGGWTIQDNVGGTTGSAPNNWFVSCAEAGITPPGCGTSCNGDATLHIGANPGAGGDMGASFNETGATNATYKMAVSPTISTVGYTGITLLFDFIAYGSPNCSDDRAQLRLSTDGGATWPVGYQYCLNTVCCGTCNGYSVGQWTTYTLSLPAAFNNNPNLKIGFHWVNNGNGSGSDPAVAIDDIQLTTTALPLNLIDFNARMEQKKAKLNWMTTDETGFSHFEVERSGETKSFRKVNQVAAKGNGRKGTTYYLLEDTPVETPTVYYRLKMVDKDGSFKYSPIISVANESASQASLNFENLVSGDKFLKLYLNTSTDLNARVDLYDLQGKKLISLNSKSYPKGQNTITLDVSKLKTSYYIVHVTSDDRRVDLSGKFFKAN